MANYWSVFMDETVWPNPHDFQPMRFMDDCGNVKNVEGFIPFSLGKRSCPGESLARPEMFLILTALVHTFTFHVPHGEVLPAPVGTTGSVYVPPKFSVCARPRY
ncbi:cytochrome P450 2D4-like [Lingula anatina]|uniref:Cytochrome P450 2D4-like n=1 Tax=Lingula anatina TaxID=7574 RepID=A0A1S3HW11_LINAN|nr:cytochrome P450 2D4-like [Lingula anatina]|eukprot:XP_013389736.1 cytochrome P450 2D4-like [Lingula anatina]